MNIPTQAGRGTSSASLFYIPHSAPCAESRISRTAPSKGGNGIVISHPNLVSGSRYTLKTSSGSTTLTASMEAQGGNGGGGNPGGNSGGNPGGGNPGGGPGGRW